MSLKRKLRSDRPKVPEVPREIPGPCVYGYLITDEHRIHFRNLYSDTKGFKEFQISDPDALVSYASVIISEIHIAKTYPVYDHQAKEAVCLVLISYMDRCRPIDRRWSGEFITNMKTALGIKGEPDWYPCCFEPGRALMSINQGPDFAMSLKRKLRSDRPLVPEVPHEITGPCVYGYLITDEHRVHFRNLYSDTEWFKEFQIADPDALVSYASVIISEIHIAKTYPVYDHQGKEAVCLVLISYMDRCRPIDRRWSGEFITNMKTALGIKGEPDWYPCCFKPV